MKKKTLKNVQKLEPRSPLTSRYPHFFTVAPSFSRVPKSAAAPPWSLLRCRSSAIPSRVPLRYPRPFQRNNSLGPRSTKVPHLTRFSKSFSKVFSWKTIFQAYFGIPLGLLNKITWWHKHRLCPYSSSSRSHGPTQPLSHHLGLPEKGALKLPKLEL